jgi:histidine triad (HIT) family protein
MENCIFCKIIAGKIPSYKIWEDENYLAILTIRPQKKGHTMVIPKKHINYIFDMVDDELSQLILTSKKMAQILKKVYKPRSGKIAMLTMGMGVPHVHVHLLPLEEESDVNPTLAHDASKAELTHELEKIKARM